EGAEQAAALNETVPQLGRTAPCRALQLVVGERGAHRLQLRDGQVQACAPDVDLATGDDGVRRRVFPGCQLLEVRVVVVGRLARWDKRILKKIHGAVTG